MLLALNDQAPCKYEMSILPTCTYMCVYAFLSNLKNLNIFPKICIFQDFKAKECTLMMICLMVNRNKFNWLNIEAIYKMKLYLIIETVA